MWWYVGYFRFNSNDHLRCVNKNRNLFKFVFQIYILCGCYQRIKMFFWLGWVLGTHLHSVNLYLLSNITIKILQEFYFYSFLFLSFFYFILFLYILCSSLDKWFLITDQLVFLFYFMFFGVVVFVVVFFSYFISVVRFWNLIYTFRSRLMEFGGFYFNIWENCVPNFVFFE